MERNKGGRPRLNIDRDLDRIADYIVKTGEKNFTAAARATGALAPDRYEPRNVSIDSHKKVLRRHWKDEGPQRIANARTHAERWRNVMAAGKGAALTGAALLAWAYRDPAKIQITIERVRSGAERLAQIAADAADPKTDLGASLAAFQRLMTPETVGRFQDVQTAAIKEGLFPATTPPIALPPPREGS